MTEVVATVNGAPIDRKALEAAMQSLAMEQFRTGLDGVAAEARAELREMALERLIARELIYQAALAEGVVASAEEVAAETARIVRLAGNPANFWERLAERGMDPVAFERMVRKDVTADLMTARRLEEVPEPEEAEILAFFRDHPEQLRRPERVRVSHLLLAVDPDAPDQAMQQAEALKQQAQQEDFKALAKQHSVCPSAPGGGDLGMVRREEVDPAFADAIFAAPVGEVGGPVRSAFGVHLFLVEARDNPGPPTLEEARPRISEVLKRLQAGRLMAAWVAELRQAATISVTAPD